MEPTPRLLRPVGAPLACYFRPGRNDHRTLMQALAERASVAGVVFDPALGDRQDELRVECLHQRLDAVIDPRTVELSTPGGFELSGVAQLPWATDQPHTIGALSGHEGERLVDALVGYLSDKQANAVLAPSHFLTTAEDPWFKVDRDLTRRLRVLLDASGMQETRIYYPLAVHARCFTDHEQRLRTIALLQTLPIDALWLRVHPFGSTSGPLALRRYMEACRDFHSLQIPIVAERSGTIGVALLAFGAVGGIEGGVTFGERYDVARLMRKRTDGTPFLPPPRVYIPSIGAFLTREKATQFFSNRQMKVFFGCKDARCCQRGADDMLSDPRRHFVTQRLREIGVLSKAPAPLRPQLYMDEFLRPATDLALKAVQVESTLETQRRRLESWRHMLGAVVRSESITSYAAAPEGKRIRRRLGA